jgi:hypothetical protein
MLDYLLGMYVGRNMGSAQAEFVAQGAKSAARGAASKADELEVQVNRLTLFAIALAELLAERGSLTEELLMKKVAEIDLRDGRRDGRMQTSLPPQPCPSCDRMLAAYHLQCIYCGAARPGSSAAHHLGR